MGRNDPVILAAGGDSGRFSRHRPESTACVRSLAPIPALCRR